MAEQRKREKQRGEQARPPTPDWVMEHGIGVGSPAMEVHVGGCYAAGDRLKVISREQAQGALAEGVRACTHCRPDTQLGML
ncbi:thioredoxin reductase [Streptomyces sp. TE33382]